MNYLVWGTGSDAKVFLSEQWQEFFIKNSILAFIDNNDKKIGKTFFYKKIINPSMINQYDFDKIIICSSYETEIKQQINNLNIQPKYVITKNDFYTEIYKMLGSKP